jgi:hypothetical protein
MRQPEGTEDYYIDGITGHRVFTAKYLLSLGKCCENKCRHCPYMAKEKITLVALDIDGCLTTQKDVKKYRFRDFSPDCVENLKHVLKECPNTRIVISSVWRGDMFNLGRLWERHGLNGEIVLGGTPQSWSVEGENRSSHRGEEIKMWLSEKVQSWYLGSKYEYSKIAIIDDDVGDITPYFPPEQIFKTTIMNGITPEIAERIVKYFKS